MLKPLTLSLLTTVPFAIPNALDLALPSQLSTVNPSISSSLHPSPSTDADLGIHCFHQEKDEPPFSRTTIEDCIDASARLWKTGLSEPFDFHRAVGGRFPLPMSFTNKTCTIWLDMDGPDAQDTFDMTVSVGLLS